MELDQIAIALFGALAAWLSQARSEKLRRWACIFGMLGQPAWFYAAWKADQWGIFLVSVIYLGAWMRGVWVHWIAPPPRLVWAPSRSSPASEAVAQVGLGQSTGAFLVKFIHTADLHLDSPLRGLSSYPDAPAERLRTATRDAFERLVTVAIDEKVDFMVIAGDVYDGDWKDFNTGLFFVRQMGRLRQAGIPVYLLYGNHDADSEMTKGLELPDNVHAFASRKAETFRIEPLKVALHGRSFKVAATTENLLPGYPMPVVGWLNIGVLHTALEGLTEHPKYAPCTVPELQAKGYQYWALGHVHEQRIERGDTTIAYPGNLQGRHIRETGPRGALLVSAEEGEITEIERIEVDVLRWHALDVDVSPCEDLRSAVRLAGQAMEDLLTKSPAGLPLAVRVSFTGQSAAHAALASDEGQLRQEMIAQAVALDPDRIWIEKVRVATTAPATQASGLEGEAQDALNALQELAASAHADPEFLQSLQADWQAMLEKLPHDVLQASLELAELRQAEPSLIADRVRQATPVLMARVAGASTAA